ncbi:NmrA family transcriptional regulator [Streptomyces venezuelae]|uniref:NmrA family transcriptional regulator n=1 Tax=Streptomyces venezuelae TaxID=54571 RepID=A0A5P2CX69_STRVZ|nr:NmrA family NAD(P)-binding protein [Streptomyces venezuelae]QES47504.1 NmrA family transcriptional regulator [Streptomyces venezuelae]
MTEDRPRRYLVTGVTGFQGGTVARLLTARGHEVRGLARHPEGVLGPVDPAVTFVPGDLGNAEDVRRAFEGVTHAAVVLPLVYDIETITGYARNIADAAREAGVERLVYNVNTPLPEVTTAYAGFESRRAAEEVLRASGVPTVVVRPPVYLDNLFSPWNGPALVNDGVLAYPLPADQRVAWLSHVDLAELVVAALEKDGVTDRVLPIGGADVLTGPELAALFAQVLGREVSYLPLPVDQFEQGLGQVLGAEAAAGVAGIYHHVGTGEAPDLLHTDPRRVESELGVRLTPTVEWIKAQPWDHWSQAAH